MYMDKLTNNTTLVESTQLSGKCLSLSSWVNLDSHDEINENLSLSLRAQLLYGKHLYEDLINNGNFGDEEHIIRVLKLCEQEGVLIIHEDKNNKNACQEKKTSNKRPSKRKLYKKLLTWLK